MADAPTLISILAPVAVGGVIGIAGSLIGPPVLELCKQVAEKKKKKAEKLEELIATLHEFDYWMYASESAILRRRAETAPIRPSGKVQAITYMYFPQFSQDVERLEALAAEHHKWIIFVGTQISTDEFREMKPKVYLPYKDAFNSLLGALVKYARCEFKSTK